jgi:hypothetical protein
VISLLLLGFTVGLTLGMLTRFGVGHAWTRSRKTRQEKRLSKKDALTLFAVVIVGFTAWLYLTTFAGIMDLTYRTGQVTIKADRLMPAESILLFCISNGLAFMATYIFMTHLRKTL